MVKKNTASTDPAASSSPDANPTVATPPEVARETTPEVADLNAGPEIELVQYQGKDGTKLAQDEIYVMLDDRRTRVGYAGHGPKGGIVYIRKIPDDLKLEIERRVNDKLGHWPTKVATAPELEDLAGDVPIDEEPEEFFGD